MTSDAAAETLRARSPSFRYLSREIIPRTAARKVIDLTDRGRAAATVIRAGVVEVDRALAPRISASEIAGLRAGLVALAEITDQRRPDEQSRPSCP